MIRVLVVDDHPAVRAGLVGLLRSEPGLTPIGVAGSAEQALDELVRRTPDVALIDYGLPDGDGLMLCWDSKSLPRPPRVVIYSAFARPRLALAATLAGADAMLDKAAPPEELFKLVRLVAGGRTALPMPPPKMVERCMAQVDPSDIALFSMAINGTPLSEIAAVAGDDVDVTRARIRALIGRLQTSTDAMERGVSGSPRVR